MISEKMKPLVNNNSAIRAMFEEGNRMAKEFGKENVYDFSLGNPNVPAPEAVKKAITDILSEEDSTMVHGYMSNAGFEDVRQSIADSLNRRFDTDFSASNFIMTVGAATALNIILKTILNPQDEVVTFAPYFVEYGNYVRNYDGVLKVVPPDTGNFEPDIKKLSDMLGERTKAVLINTPNNPTGVVYSENTLNRMREVIESAEKKFGHTILLISDEPYRELVYDNAQVPWITGIFPHSVIVYSYSKSLSLPGERIGWLLVPDSVPDHEELLAAASIANRVCGCVNAPSLMQRVIGRCVDEKTDISAYDKNRELLYNTLIKYGFECIKPQGAFYLFVKAPAGDDIKFVEICKNEHVLVVPGTSFECSGYVRIAYCVSYDMIKRSLPAFEKIAKTCGLL